MKYQKRVPRITIAYGSISLLSVIISVFVEGSLDITTHDTYYVISMNLIFLFTALIFALFALITWGVERSSRHTYTALNWLHFGTTTLSIGGILWLFQTVAVTTTSFKDYTVFDELEEHEYSMLVNAWIAILAIIFILSQCLFILHLIFNFAKNRKRSRIDE